LCICLGLAFCVFFWFSSDYFVLVLFVFAFVVLDLVYGMEIMRYGDAVGNTIEENS